MAFTLDESYSQEAYSAKQVLLDEHGEPQTLDATRATEAEGEGVSSARFIGYADVLSIYEARSDTEHTADIRARHFAATAAEQDFARAASYDGNSGAVADSVAAEESSSSSGG